MTVFKLISSVMHSKHVLFHFEHDDVIKDSQAIVVFLFLRPIQRDWKLHFLT